MTLVTSAARMMLTIKMQHKLGRKRKKSKTTLSSRYQVTKMLVALLAGSSVKRTIAISKIARKSNTTA